MVSERKAIIGHKVSYVMLVISTTAILQGNGKVKFIKRCINRYSIIKWTIEWSLVLDMR